MFFAALPPILYKLNPPDEILISTSKSNFHRQTDISCPGSPCRVKAVTKGRVIPVPNCLVIIAWYCGSSAAPHHRVSPAVVNGSDLGLGHTLANQSANGK